MAKKFQTFTRVLLVFFVAALANAIYLVYYYGVSAPPDILLKDCFKGAIAGSVVYWFIEWLMVKFFKKGT